MPKKAVKYRKDTNLIEVSFRNPDISYTKVIGYDVIYLNPLSHPLVGFKDESGTYVYQMCQGKAGNINQTYDDMYDYLFAKGLTPDERAFLLDISEGNTNIHHLYLRLK